MDILNRKSLKNGNYFDDVFDENSQASKYRQLLFHPGRPLQVRELTQLQTLLNEYNKNYLDTVFKNGSFIEGCSLTLDTLTLSVSEGLVYFDGTVFKTDEINFEISNALNIILSSNPNINIHFLVKYNVIENDNDGTPEKNALLDPAITYFESESIIGADRLKITFELMISVVDSTNTLLYFFQDGTNSTEFDYNTNHLFDYAKASLSSIPHTLTNINYLNREANIDSIEEINTDIESEIIQGLVIQQSNIIDTNLNVDLRDGVETGDTKNNISNVIIDKGVGKIGDKYIPVSRNTVFRLDKMIETEETLKTNLEMSYFYKETSNEKEGLYFKYYFSDNKDVNLGNSIFKFDHPNNDIFLSVGTKIAIEAYDSDDHKYRTLAKANVTYVDENDFVNSNINDVDIWDKFKYKGFWKKNENFVYIQGLINSSTWGDAPSVGIYRDFDDSSGRTLKLKGITTDEILRHAVNGGVQAVGQRYEYTDVKFIKKDFYSEFFAGKNNYTEYVIKNQDIRDDFDSKKIPISGTILIINNKMYYVMNMNVSEDDDYSYPTLAVDEVRASLFLIRYKTNGQGETYITTTCVDDIEISETANYDLSIIRYHVIEEIIDENTFKIEYNGHAFNINSFKWNVLTNDINSAEEFIVLTSPVEDIKGAKTIIKGGDTTIESKFIMSTPSIPYLNTKYAFFCDSFHHMNSENTIKMIDFVEIEDGSYYNGLNYSIQTTYYVYEITFDRDLDEINVGDILYNQDMEFGTMPTLIEWWKIIIIVTEKISNRKLKVVTGFELPWISKFSQVVNVFNYTKSTPLYGSEVINGVPFWKINTIDTRILNYTDLNIYNSKNSENYGSDIDLKDFDITYYNTKFKKVFISDIQLESGENIETLYDNSISTRIVLLDVDDNLDYSHVIEEGIDLNGTKDLIIDTVNNKIKNDFNDLSIPYVKDALTDYSLYTLYNVEKAFREIDPEGNANWAQFNFTEDDKILGAYQAHGKAVLDGSKVLIKMRSADMPILSGTDWVNTLPHLASVCYRVFEDVEFDYIVNHQGNITKETGSGDLGINLYHFEDNNYIESLSFCIGSFGEGSAIENREYKVVDDLGNDISVYNALGLKYYFNLDLSSDFNSASKNGSNNVLYYEAKITDTKVNTVYRDEDDKHLIHIERNNIYDIYTGSGTDEIIFSFNNITDFKSNDVDEDFGGTQVKIYKNGAHIENRYISSVGVIDYVLKRATVTLNSAITLGADRISFDSKLDFTKYDIDDVIYFLYSDVFVFGDPLPKVLEFDFYRIKEIVSSTSVRVYEEVPDKYLKIPASQKPYVLQAVDTDETAILISANANNKLWVPYENNYSFVLNSYVGGIPINQLSNSPLYCSVITTEELTPAPSDTITLSLYKEVDKEDIETESVEGIYIKNIEFKDSYHPFMRIRENHTSLYGKPLSYYHKPLKVNVTDTYFREVKYDPMVKTQYDYILPEVVHFHLNSDGEINYTKTVPVMYNEIKPLYIQNELYLGTVTVPPIEKDAIPEGGATPMAFLNTQTQQFNLKRDLELKFENVNNKKNIKTNSNYISLNEIYNMERRDLQFSTGKKFVWWEQLGGTIKPSLSVRYRIFSANGLSKSNDNRYYGYEWNKILGFGTSFKTDLNTGDTIAVYKTVYDYLNDATNITNEPTSPTNYNPTETFVVKQILSNNELILEGEMSTTIAYTLDAGEIIVLPQSFIWNRDRMINHTSVTDASVYFDPSFLYVRREQDINFVQYLMNNREYSIFNIVNNNYIFEDDYKVLNLKKESFKFNKIQCDDIYFRRPRVDIYNNEISPITYLYSRQLDLESEIEFEEYSNGNMTLTPIINGNIKIIDTKEFNSGSIETESEDDIFDINYTLNSIAAVGAKLYDRDNAINGSYILNSDGKDLKWDFSRNKIKDYENNYSDANNDFTEFQYFDFSKDLERKNVDYNYYITHKLKTESSEFIKQTFKPTIAPSKNTGITNITLDTTPEQKVLNGISALTMANDVHLVCENNVVNYDSLTTFLSGTNGLIKLRPSIYDMINGIYDVGVINTDISIDVDENIITNPDGYNFLKISTNILCNESFNNIGEEFSYIFNQIGHCVYFERYFTDDVLAGRNIYSVFDEINKPENWEFVAPTIYQVYQFKDSYMLNNIDFYLDAQGIVGEKYRGNIAVYFGFLINDNITKSGIVRTIIKNVNMSSLEYKDGKVSIELDTPIYVPKNKKFFIGFIKETSSTPNDCSFKYIENGGYDEEDDLLISYPANCDTELWSNDVKTTNKMLKIDLTVNQYEKDTVFDIQTSTLDLTATNTTILKFMVLSTILVPEDTSIVFAYTTEIIGTDATWKVFEINDMISLSESYQELAFKVSVRTNNNFLSPIFKKNFLTRLEQLMFSNIYADDIKIKKLTYNQMLEKFKPFAWRFLGGSDTVNFFPVGITVDNIKNRLNKYDMSYGRIIQKNQLIFDKKTLPTISYNPITIPKFGN